MEPKHGHRGGGLGEAERGYVAGHPPRRLLVVDPEPGARGQLATLLGHEGFVVDVVGDGQQALATVEARPPALVLTDLRLPGQVDGLALVEALHGRSRRVPVVVLTAATDLRSGILAMRAGAADYLTKPPDVDGILAAIDRALGHAPAATPGAGLGGLLGESDVMRRVYREVELVAPSRTTVLITGESGTGKGELAVAVHALSPRAHRPLIRVHCASLAETLLESELFGHERGAFTGADRRRIGKFELAHGGTLFLDEIGEISGTTQVKLLRILQERTFERVGGNEPIEVDVRIVAATNRDLAREIAAGRFREDLYYRLAVVTIEMPPLRERGGDGLLLAERFLRRFADENGRAVTGFSERARRAIAAHAWPGNVRALANAVERAVIMAPGPVVDEADLALPGSVPHEPGVRIPGATMAEIERFAILRTLEAVGGSPSRAAEVLGLSVRTIQYRLHEYGVARDRPRHG